MPSRRTVLLSCLALASGLPHRFIAAAGFFSLDDFLALSSRLANIPAAALDRTAARVMYESYSERGLLPDLAQLASLEHSKATDSPLGNEIVAAWYSGICQSVNGPVVATYTSALIWSQTSFLHPAGACGGATGYWGDPPTI